MTAGTIAPVATITSVALGALVKLASRLGRGRFVVVGVFSCNYICLALPVLSSRGDLLYSALDNLRIAVNQ